MFLADKLNKGSGTPPDAQFNYVTMLLHGDGTNGAQNNTFVDSSTNNFTITRNGNTTQGSFSPYGSGWSNVFDGSISSAYLSVATNTAFNCGTGNFTVEAWVNITAYTGSYPLIIGNNNGGFSAGAIALTSQNATSGGASKISFTAYDINSSGVTLAAASTNTIGGWTHFAVVRNGTSLVLYINGASSASTTISAGVSLDFGKNGLLIGGGNWDTANGYYAGYISNLRLVKGTAVYTSAFTPSTTPLTAITNTSLLTCQSNRFIDNSANNFTITANSPSRVERFNPFGTATAYSTSVIGGSGYFDSNGDYLSTPSSSAFAFGTGDFTLETWVYANRTNNEIGFFQTSATAGGLQTTYNDGIFISLNSSGNGLNANVGNTTITSGNVNFTKNTWFHVAFTRSSGSCRLFVNGVLSAGPTTITANVTGTYACVGGYYSTAYLWDGYLSDVRVVKGTAVYTSAFTPPTAPLTAISGTSLLTSFTNGAIFDNAMINDLETVGNAQISTSVKKYGTGSLAFDGTGDYLTGKTVPIGSGDLTIECWVYLNVATGDQHFVQVDGASDSNVFLSLDSGANKFKFVVRNDAGTNNISITSSISPSANTWYHIAGVVSGSNAYLFVDGSTTSGATGTLSGTRSGTGTNVYLGVNGSGGFRPLNGYLDDVRITKGYARYTANFTPPTAALSDTGPI